jgi:hypothetical protein
MGLLGDLVSLLFPPKRYGQHCVTPRGEVVKSHAEKRIAEFFQRNGIQYVYEPLVESHFWIFSNKISRPDFYLPDFNVYVEYWGMVDVEDEFKRAEYIRLMKWKMAKYRQHGIKFISIYPKNLKNLDWIFRAKFKETVGVELPPKSQSCQ